TGRLPFEGRESATLFGAIIGTEAPAVSSLAPGVPSSVDQVAGRALAKDPKERYQTASEFCRDLEDVLNALDTKDIKNPVASPVQKQLLAYPRTLLALVSILATVVGLTFIGFLTSTVYGSPLGLTTSFEGESPLWWPVWGVRSLILPLGQIVVALMVVGVATQLWRIALGTFRPLRRRYEALVMGRKLLSRVQAFPTLTLAGSLLMIHIIAVALFWWRFHDLLGSIDNFLHNSGSLAALSPEHGAEHIWYVRSISLLVLTIGWSWYRLLKTKLPALKLISASTLVPAAGVMLLTF